MRFALLAGVGCADPAPHQGPVVLLPPGPLGPPTGALLLYGTETLDVAGLELDVADADGDGSADVLVAAPSIAVYGYGEASSSSAYLLRHPTASGLLDDLADAVFPARYVDDNQGSSSAILPEDRLLILSNNGDGSVPARLYDGRTDGVVPFDRAVAGFDARGAGDLGMQHLENCHAAALGAGSWCWTTTSWQDNALDYSGAVILLPPLGPDGIGWDDALVTVHGEASDRAEVVDGSHDLDGDGFSDLAIGAYASSRDDDPGRVSVVTGGPTGIVPLADVTVASFRGEIPGAELGLAVHAGDLDGDGSADVFGGAPITEVRPCVYGMATPWTGETPGTDTDWRFCGERWLGYDFALGDFDGDGSTDLAAGAPDDWYHAVLPGVVVVWAAPAPGTHDLTDADAIFGSGSPGADSFGYEVGAGDIDGDGRDDLALGAPMYDELAQAAGLVAIVPGGGL